LCNRIVYVKVEVGTLTISFKDNVVEAIEERKGSPLNGKGVADCAGADGDLVKAAKSCCAIG